jgi:hypothetical protein
VAPMTADTPDTTAAVEHVRRLGEVDVHLTATELKLGFVFQGKLRILERAASRFGSLKFGGTLVCTSD